MRASLKLFTCCSSRFCIAGPTRLAVEIRCGDARLELEAVRAIRKILSVERHPPVQQVLQSGVLPSLVELLKRSDASDIQFEAAWALTNIASTEHTKVRSRLPQIVTYILEILSNEFADRLWWSVEPPRSSRSSCFLQMPMCESSALGVWGTLLVTAPSCVTRCSHTM